MIRKVELADKKQIELLGQELNPDYAKLFDLSKLLKYKYTRFYVWEEGKQIIGFIHANVFFEDGDIINIVVAKNYRRKQIGTQLFNYLLANNPIKNLTLEVNINNKKAIAFYQKQGLEVLTIRKNYYPDGDGYLMGRKYEK